MKHGDWQSLPANQSGASVCLFCSKGVEIEDKAGKLHKQRRGKSAGERVAIHHHCAYFASGLAMRSDTCSDDEIDGFHVKDIITEAKRGARLRCSVCGKNGATIGCVDEKCQAKYHFPCAEKAQALHVFAGSFPTYCRAHRPSQNLRKRVRELVELHAADQANTSRNNGNGTRATRGDARVAQSRNKAVEVDPDRLKTILADLNCPVCLESLKDCCSDPIVVVHGGCCPKSFFHRSCIQAYARSAGYFFCCPLCKDQKRISTELRDHGIEIPERDAAWELEADAFNELYQRHSRCDAPKCHYSGGRNHSIDYHSKWDHIICSTCGWKGTHRFCSALDKKSEKEIESWQCDECREIWTKEHDESAGSQSCEGNSTRETTLRDDQPNSSHADDRPPTDLSSRPPSSHTSDSEHKTTTPLKNVSRPTTSSSVLTLSRDANGNTILSASKPSEYHKDEPIVRTRRRQRKQEPESCDADMHSVCASPAHSTCTVSTRASLTTHTSQPGDPVFTETGTPRNSKRLPRNCASTRSRRATVGVERATAATRQRGAATPLRRSSRNQGMTSKRYFDETNDAVDKASDDYDGLLTFLSSGRKRRRTERLDSVSTTNSHSVGRLSPAASVASSASMADFLCDASNQSTSGAISGVQHGDESRSENVANAHAVFN